MVKVTDVYREICQILSQNPNADNQFEAELLLEEILGKKTMDLPRDYLVPYEKYSQLISLAQRRQGGYPLQYILGKWQFFDIELTVGEGVLIPRADTESVCEAAFEVIKSIPKANVLDLCSGSGAIALAVKKYCPDTTVLALEKSKEAFVYLEKNIKDTGLTVLPILADVFWFDENIEDESFDVIISNPPYINQNLKGTLQKEIEFEPELALFTTDHGLRFYKFIAECYREKIKDNGYLIFEYGFDQKEWVKSIMQDFGYAIIKEITDLSGNPRGIIGQKR